MYRFLGINCTIVAKAITARHGPENFTYHLGSVISFFLLYPSSHLPACPAVLRALSPGPDLGAMPVLPKPLQTSRGGCCRILLHLASVLLSWLTCELYPALEALTMFEANIEHLCQTKQLWPQFPGLLSRALPALCPTALQDDVLRYMDCGIGLCLPWSVLVMIRTTTRTMIRKLKLTVYYVPETLIMWISVLNPHFMRDVLFLF